MVNLINPGGGDPLCTLHPPAEGLYTVHTVYSLYRWVTRKGYYEIFRIRTKLNQVYYTATQAGLYAGPGRSTASYCTLWAKHLKT